MEGANRTLTLEGDFMKSLEQRAYRHSLVLILFESAITANILSKSIMSPFFISLGMNQVDIATSQAVFTIAMVLLGLPTGWLADRFSRKWANVIGDFGYALVLLGYSTVGSFSGVICYEILSGVFRSLSKGVDLSLLRHCASKLDPDGNLFWVQAARLALVRNISTMVLMLLGGPIGAMSFRLAIAVSSIPYWLGGIAALFIRDDSARLARKDGRNPFRAMWRIVRNSLHDKPLRLRIAAFAIGREMTRSVTWIFTPMLLYVGVPLSIVSCGWALKSLACIIGTRFASRFAAKMQDWQIFAIPLALMTISMGTLSLSLNIVTIWLYLLLGVAQGWTSATFAPMVQKYADPSEQTSVLSFTYTVGKLIHAPAIWLTGWAADLDLCHATSVTLIVFGILGLILLIKLLRE